MARFRDNNSRHAKPITACRVTGWADDRGDFATWYSGSNYCWCMMTGSARELASLAKAINADFASR